MAGEDKPRFTTFGSIYKFFNPRDFSGTIQAMGGTTTRQENLYEEFMKFLFNQDNGSFTKFSKIKEKISEKLTAGSNPDDQKKIEETKKELRKSIHAIGESVIDFGDEDYWGGPQGTKSLNSFVRPLAKISGGSGPESKVPVSCFAIRHPYLNPACRSTQEVELFLNYMPSIMASRIVPYLEVNFQIKGSPLYQGSSIGPALSTPSQLRFLLGSVNVDSLSAADKALYQATNPLNDANEKNQKNLKSPTSYAGMEMFLMPQTLTNMNALGNPNDSKPGGSRLVPVRPFMPFASIEDFQVSILNAGAGAMAHKKGSLKLKIHDKSRLAEISEFIRGPVGFRQAVIWTTYGWIAPRMPDSELDAYSKFINENMHSEDCWQVSNTQFSFDVSGQVSLSIDMVSKGVSKLNRAKIGADDSNLAAQFENMQKVMEEISEIKAKMPTSDLASVGVEVRQSELLNAVSSGNFPYVENVGKEIESLVLNLVASSAIDSAAAKSLKEDLEKAYGVGTDGLDFNTRIKEMSAGAVAKKLLEVAQGPDPFLADDSRAGSPDVGYFDPDLVKVIKDGARITPSESEDQRAKKEQEKQDKAADENIEKLRQSEAAAQALKDKETKDAEIAKIKLEFKEKFDKLQKKYPNFGEDYDKELTEIKQERDKNLQKFQPEKTPEPKEKTPVQIAEEKRNAEREDRSKQQEKLEAEKELERRRRETNRAKELDFSNRVISFGKLFMGVIAPAVVKSTQCDELQVMFYSLNEQCGPSSNISVAEFAIDLVLLGYAYRDAVKSGAYSEMTVEQFLGLIVNSQFNDNRAIGYGMAHMYEPFDPDNREAKQIVDEQFQSRNVDWLRKYGGLKRPALEILIETNKVGENSSSGKISIHDKIRKSEKSKSEDQESFNAFTDSEYHITRIHVYDKQNNPFKSVQQFFSTGPGQWQAGSLNATLIREKVHNGLQQDKQKTIEAINKGEFLNFDESLKLFEGSKGTEIRIDAQADKFKLRNILAATVPNIIMGVNGTMVKSANIASKTEGLAAAGNIVSMNKGTNKNGAVAAGPTGLEGPNGLPLRMFPAQLTMTTAGCPIAQLYQAYFIDFQTGTTIDNLYNCSQIQHSISPGKFDTNWTFIYTEGYGKFAGAPSVDSIAKQELSKELQAAAETFAAQKKKDAPAGGGEQK